MPFPSLVHFFGSPKGKSAIIFELAELDFPNHNAHRVWTPINFSGPMMELERRISSVKNNLLMKLTDLTVFKITGRLLVSAPSLKMEALIREFKIDKLSFSP